MSAHQTCSQPLIGWLLPFWQEELLEAAKNLFLKQDSGLSNPDMLSEDFT